MTTQTQPRPAPEQRKARNTVGIIALVAAIVGAIFAVVPGALLLGWILLPIAFILSIVSLFMKDQKRGQGIAALIISIVGTIIGFMAFLGMAGSAIDEAFNDDVEISDSTQDEAVESTDTQQETPDVVADEDDAEGEEGTRDNPLALGSTISDANWEVTLNSVDLHATDAVLSENPLNDEPEPGNGYVTANVTATYIGEDPAGETPSGVRVEYVSAGGNSYDSTASMVIVPDYFNRSETLYEGASTTGNFGVEVPLEDVENGNILLSPTMFGDGVFFAVQ